jgi:hypothetical protein
MVLSTWRNGSALALMQNVARRRITSCLMESPKGRVVEEYRMYMTSGYVDVFFVGDMSG